MNPDYAHWRAVMLDSLGRFRSKSLFWELRNIDRADVYEPLFTTKDRPHTVATHDKKGMVTYPSLKQLYLAYDHVPGQEYEFAMDIFGSWKHWEHLNRSSLKDMIQEWKDELTIKLKAEAIKNIITASKESSATGTVAAKYLADEGYIPKKVGRITKEDKLREIRVAAGVRDDLAGDMERLGIQVISGKK